MRIANLAPALLLATLLLVGCNSSGGDDSGSGSGAGSLAKAADLCVSSSCGEAVHLVPIPDAENILFAPDGRLFVTGGLNVYEITKAGDGSFSATALADASCSFTGMAIIGNTLYANGCNKLFAGALGAQPALTAIYDFVGMCIPNGMAAGPDGRLYVVDEPLNVNPPANCLPPNPKIIRLTLTDPTHVASQEVWVQGSPLGLLSLGLDNVLRFPNGLVRDGNTFFGTDGGSIYSVDYQPDGTAGVVKPLFFEVAVHDDLGLVADGLLLADFALGKISLISREGTLLQQTDPLTFSFPSSTRLGRPPMFKPTDILVTEKGVITDNSLPIDFLTLFRPKATN